MFMTITHTIVTTSTMNLHTNLSFFSVLLLLFILFSSSFLTSAKADIEFTYEEGSSEGPQNWWLMNPKWKLCGEGKQQSPIDISDKVVHFPQLGQLERDYKPARAVLKNSGHIIEMKWKGNAGQLNLNGTNYKLIQCHWHTPSEHTLNGTKFDLELHVVHQNSVGERAAIGIWYKIGDSDPLLSELLEKLKSLGDEDIDVGEINPGIIKFGSRYYRYDGSLTTPPCTEGVVWTIMKKVRTVSTEQLSALKGAIRHEYEENGRPTQALNERQVWLYNIKKKPT